MRRVLILLMVLASCSPYAYAQGSVDAENIYLGPTGGTICRIRLGSGSPESAVTGTVCHVLVDTGTGNIYAKTSGSGNTGWSIIYRAGGTDVPVTDGGTGVSTFTSNGVLYGNGTGALQVTAGGPASSVLTANGGVPIFTANPTVTSLTATSVITPSVTTGSNLTLSPTGDLITDPVGNDILPDANYDINIGMLSKKYLTLHAAELWVETLVAQNTIATIGGRVLVAPTTPTVTDTPAAQTNINVKYNQAAVGDILYMEAAGKVEFMVITAGPATIGPDHYQYLVTRNLDGSGANDWFAGDAVLNTGTTGDGFIDLYSLSGVLSGAGPTIVGNVRTGTTYNNIAARWAIGNLNGLYGVGVDTYGVAFGDASATNIIIDATDGFRIRSGTTDKLTADLSGNLNLVGDLILGTSGVFRSGATAFGTGTGLWMDYNAGTPRFRVGNPAGSYLQFDGTNVKVASGNLTIDSSIGSIVMAPYTSGPSPNLGHGYAFSTATGLTGMFGAEPTSTELIIQAQSTTTTAQQVVIQTLVSSTQNQAQVAVTSTTSGGDVALFGNQPGGSTGGYLNLHYASLAPNLTGFSQISNGLWIASGDLEVTDRGMFGGIVGIGQVPSSSFQLSVTRPTDGSMFIGNTTAGVGSMTFMQFTRNATSSGSITCTPGACAYNTTSDRRVKTDLAATRYGIADVMRVPVYDGRYLTNGSRGTFVVAQELWAAFPDAVHRPADLSAACDPHGDMRGCWQVDYGRLTPLLLAGEQDLQRQITALRAEVTALRKQVQRR